MKTALDLPDELIKEVKMQAVLQGRKLKDMIAELLRRGLDATADPGPSPIVTNRISGLPMIACRQPAPIAERLTPERAAKILLGQETAWNHEAGR